MFPVPSAEDNLFLGQVKGVRGGGLFDVDVAGGRGGGVME